MLRGVVGGGEFAELGYGGGDDFEGGGDFGFGGVAAEAEADTGACVECGETDGGEDMGGFDGSGGAGGSGGTCQALQIESYDESFAFEAGE